MLRYENYSPVYLNCPKIPCSKLTTSQVHPQAVTHFKTGAKQGINIKMVIRLISLHELDVLFFEGKVKNKGVICPYLLQCQN